MFTIKLDPFEIAVKEEALPELYDVKMEVEDSSDHDAREDWSVSIRQCREMAEGFRYSRKEKSYAFEDLTIKGVYGCELCPKLFLNRFKVIQHKLHHLRVNLSTPPMFQCDTCHVIFTKKKSLSKHFTLKHDTRRSTPVSQTWRECFKCHKVFKYRHWHGHMRTVHGDGSYKCTICLKFFKCERYLLRHRLYMHEDKKPQWMLNKERPKYVPDKLQCTECTKTFKSNDCLKHHVKNVHSGGSFTCKICSSVLRSETYLRTHMRRVHYDDGKTHNCTLCRKFFKSPRYLKVHINNAHVKKYAKKKSSAAKKTQSTNYISAKTKLEIMSDPFENNLLINVGAGHVTNVIKWENM